MGTLLEAARTLVALVTDSKMGAGQLRHKDETVFGSWLPGSPIRTPGRFTTAVSFHAPDPYLRPVGERFFLNFETSETTPARRHCILPEAAPCPLISSLDRRRSLQRLGR